MKISNENLFFILSDSSVDHQSWSSLLLFGCCVFISIEARSDSQWNNAKVKRRKKGWMTKTSDKRQTWSHETLRLGLGLGGGRWCGRSHIFSNPKEKKTKLNRREDETRQDKNERDGKEKNERIPFETLSFCFHSQYVRVCTCVYVCVKAGLVWDLRVFDDDKNKTLGSRRSGNRHALRLGTENSIIPSSSTTRTSTYSSFSFSSSFYS